MKEYHSTPSNKRYGFDHLPIDDFRMYDEEIKSTVEYERETMGTKKDLSTISEGDEFAFENSRSTANNENKNSINPN